MTDQPVTADTDPSAIVDEVKAAPRRLRPLRRILPFMLAYPVRLTLTLLFMTVSTVASLAIPALMGGVIDEGFISQNLENVGRYA